MWIDTHSHEKYDNFVCVCVLIKYETSAVNIIFYTMHHGMFRGKIWTPQNSLGRVFYIDMKFEIYVIIQSSKWTTALHGELWSSFSSVISAFWSAEFWLFIVWVIALKIFILTGIITVIPVKILSALAKNSPWYVCVIILYIF